MYQKTAEPFFHTESTALFADHGYCTLYLPVCQAILTKFSKRTDMAPKRASAKTIYNFIISGIFLT